MKKNIFQEDSLSFYQQALIDSYRREIEKSGSMLSILRLKDKLRENLISSKVCYKKINQIISNLFID